MTKETRQEINDRCAAAIVARCPRKQDVIWNSEAFKGTLLIAMQPVGLVVGFIVTAEIPPDRVTFTDQNNYTRINAPWARFAGHAGGKLIPLAVSETDLRGAVYAAVVNADAILTLQGCAGRVTVRQWYYDDIPWDGRLLALPVMALCHMRRIIDGQDEVIYFGM